MAADINKIVLIGRLTRDCELKQLTNTSVCNFSIAVNRRVNQGGNWVDDVSYFDIELFGTQATAISQYLLKGKQVGIEGALRQSRWESQDGQKRSRVTIVASNIQLLGGGQSSNLASNSGQQGYDSQPHAQGGGYNNQAGYNNQVNSPNTMENQQQSGQSGQSTASFTPDANDFQDDIPF